MGEQDPGIGMRVRAGRDRLGWSREALAFHSGLSWAGIAQVESGRRRDVRSGTLAALATALGVSVDYLVLGRRGARMLDHRLSMYGSDEELVAAAAPFLSRAVEHQEPALAVTTRRNISLLRRGVGDAVDAIRFVESSSWHTSPLAALDDLEEFCATAFEQRAAWARVVVQLAWAQWPASAARSWIRLESLLNVAFAHSPVSILCVCDTRSLNTRIERQLSLTHPETSAPGDPAQSPACTDPRAFLLES